MDRTRPLVIAAIVLLGLLAVSGVRPYDRLTWLMEVAPVLITLPVLWTTWRRFPLTTLLYACIFVHAVVLIVGVAVRFDRLAWWWALVSAAFAALGTLWIGPRFDAACRAALRGPR